MRMTLASWTKKTNKHIFIKLKSLLKTNIKLTEMDDIYKIIHTDTGIIHVTGDMYCLNP